MKKILSYAACLLIVSSVAATPNSKILKSFSETFPNANNVKWSDDKEGYFVSFTHNGNLEKVLYSKKGDFVCSWKYSDGKDLPLNIIMALKQKYKDSEITGVTEYATGENIAYEIKLANDKNWYSVTASANGKLSNEEKYSK